MPGESWAFFLNQFAALPVRMDSSGRMPRPPFLCIANGDAGTPACRNAMQATVRQRLRFNALINNFIPR